MTLSYDLQSGVHAGPAAAFAKGSSGGGSGSSGSGGGGSGSSGSGSDGSGSSGSGSSGSGSSGSGSGGSGSGGSGSGGSGSGGSGSDDSGNSGPGGDYSDDSGSVDNSGGGSTGPSSQPVTSRLQSAGQNMTLSYSNGWEETILNGRYQLTDPLGHTVSKRAATRADFLRMLEAAGQ